MKRSLIEILKRENIIWMLLHVYLSNGHKTENEGKLFVIYKAQFKYKIIRKIWSCELLPSFNSLFEYLKEKRKRVRERDRKKVCVCLYV